MSRPGADLLVETLRTHGGKRAKDYFDGTADPRDVLGKSDIDISRGKEIARGVIKRDDETIYYVSMEGELSVKGSQMEGISTMMYIECPNDDRFRLGIWFGPKLGEDDQVVAFGRTERAAAGQTAPERDVVGQAAPGQNGEAASGQAASEAVLENSGSKDDDDRQVASISYRSAPACMSVPRAIRAMEAVADTPAARRAGITIPVADSKSKATGDWSDPSADGSAHPAGP